MKLSQIKSLSQEKIHRKLDKLKSVFSDILVKKDRSGYPYSLFSITDCVPPIQPDLIEDAADLLVYYGNFENVDLIVSEADRGGGPLTHAVAVRTGLPYVLANWYPQKNQAEIFIATKVGFSGHGYLCLNGISKGCRTIIVDDLLSSGGTSIGLIKAIEKGGGSVKETLFIGEKVDQGGRKRILDNFPQMKIISLIKFSASGKTTKLIE